LESEFQIQGPSGLKPLPVTRELYFAVKKMLEEPNGTMTVNFSAGRIFSVDAITKHKFSGQ